MALRLADDGGERGGDDRDELKEARRTVGATRARLEELADRLRELGRRLGGGGSDDGRFSPETGEIGKTGQAGKMGTLGTTGVLGSFGGASASSPPFEPGRSPSESRTAPRRSF